MSSKKWLLIGSIGCVGLLALIVGGGVLIFFLAGLERKYRFEEVADIPAPDMSGIPIYSPSFDTGLGPVLAGTAFLATDPTTDAVYLLSAHHLLGEAGGLYRDLKWDEVSDMVRSVTCQPDIAGFEPLSLNEVIPIAGANTFDFDSGSNDLLVFKAPDSLRKYAIPLRLEPLKEKEPVWLYSAVYGSDQVLHLALVDVVKDELLEYFFRDDVDLQATSGAPVIDAQGRLAGINLGGYYSGAVNGFSNPVGAIKKRLDRAKKEGPSLNHQESPK